MSLTNALTDILEKYRDVGQAKANPPAGVHDDFEQVANNAPKEVTAAGVEQAFQSDQTPPFPQMVAQLFEHADGSGRAGLLNRLLQSVGGAGAANVPGASTISRLLQGNRQQVAPEQAAQIPPQEVEQLAAHAQSRNPAAVSEVSRFASEHPGMVKGLGMAALAIVMHHISRRI